MKREKTKVLSLRVPEQVADRVDAHIKQKDIRGGRQELLADILIPALNRRLKREQKAVQVA